MLPRDSFIHPWSGKPVEALLFDLDGTLVDSAPDIATAINDVLSSEGLAELDVPTVRTLIGEGIRRLTEKAFAIRGNALSSNDLDSKAAAFSEKYASCIADRTAPMPGVIEGLAGLRQAGFKTAVVSNKAQGLTEQLLEQIQLTQFFDYIQGAQAALAPKPAPDMVRAALSNLKCTPDVAAFVGDSSIDVATGAASSLPVFLLKGGYTGGAELPEGAFQVFQDFHGLVSWIQERDG